MRSQFCKQFLRHRRQQNPRRSPPRRASRGNDRLGEKGAKGMWRSETDGSNHARRRVPRSPPAQQIQGFAITVTGQFEGGFLVQGRGRWATVRGGNGQRVAKSGVTMTVTDVKGPQGHCRQRHRAEGNIQARAQRRNKLAPIRTRRSATLQPNAIKRRSRVRSPP